MPNWCENKVEVYGEIHDIIEWKAFVKSDTCEFDFNKIIPMPKELEETVKGSEHVPSKELIEKYGADNWYDWRIFNWGTKWDVNDVQIEEETDYMQYSFDTAWSPPDGIHSKLKEKFPDLSITWFWNEPGVQEAGYL